MIDQGELILLRQHFGEQRLDKVKEVVDLLEFASAVLVEFAFPREDMQLFEQGWGLFGADFVFLGHGGFGNGISARV